MLAKYLSRFGRVTKRGYRVSEAIDTVIMFIVFFGLMAIVGSIESSKYL